MKELKDGIRSHVRLDFKGHVHKQFRGTNAEQRFANEVAVLKALKDRGAPNVPELIEYDQDTLTLVTTNCGSPAPLITEKKAKALFQELEDRYGIRHDDPEPRNVTYSQQMGKFCLIDFELSEILAMPEEIRAQHSNELRVSWAGSSTQGNCHAANDDSFLALAVGPEHADTLPDSGEILLDPSHLVLAVSDGMGGANAGEFASRILMSRIRKNAHVLHQRITTDNNGSILGELLAQCHQDINNLAQQCHSTMGMGATLTVAWISHTEVFWVHIGDSRLYLIDDEGVQQLTEDDNLAWHQWQRGEITEYAYRFHPHKSVINDVLGGGLNEPVAQLGSFLLKDSQKLMLCSDGIMDGLWEDTIRVMLADPKPPKETLTAMVKRAMDNDGRDDTTMIVAKIARI